MRYVDVMPFEQDGQDLILLSDAEGVVESALAVTREVAFMVALMDGTRTLRDIQAEFSGPPERWSTSNASRSS